MVSWWVSELMSWWVGELVSLWGGEFMSWWVYELVSWWVGELVSWWVRVFVKWRVFVNWWVYQTTSLQTTKHPAVRLLPTTQQQQKKRGVRNTPYTSFNIVAETRLEHVTSRLWAWRATNCSTPRYKLFSASFSDLRVQRYTFLTIYANFMLIFSQYYTFPIAMVFILPYFLIVRN